MALKRSLPPPTSPAKRSKLQGIEQFLKSPSKVTSSKIPKVATEPVLSDVLDEAGADTYHSIQSSTDDSRNDPVALEAARLKIKSNKALSDFRKLTLLLLSQVPRGRWTTYQCLANAAADVQGHGKKGSARALGSAMRNNPYAPIVPCHRVLASDGTIGGFAGEITKKGAVEGEKVCRKREMLREEGVKFESQGKVKGLPFDAFTSP